MNRPLLRWGATVAYGALVVGAAVAPALAFDSATARGGAARAAGVDLVLASAAVGVPYAVFVCRRLVRADRGATDRWLSAVHGLVVLSLAASALPAAVLHASARLHARVADAEWPVLLAWSSVIGVAVLLAEGTRRASLRYLLRDRKVLQGRASGD